MLPGEHRLGGLLEQAHDLIRIADQLSGKSQPGALDGLRGLLRAMNSYYTNRIEGQHTLPAEIKQALRNDYSAFRCAAACATVLFSGVMAGGGGGGVTSAQCKVGEECA